MLHVPSELHPYNDMWLDCVKNNLMSILIAYNKSFETLPLTFKAQYTKKITAQFLPGNTITNFLKQGMLLPKVAYVSDELYSFFNIDRRFLEPSDLNNIHVIIREALQNQQYVFCKVDRFFYPSGRESGQIHFGHPVFIHGYSEADDCYLTFEDCLTPGTIHSYPLPCHVIDSSAQSFIDDAKEATVTTVSINSEVVSNYQTDITENTLLELLNYTKINQRIHIEQFELYYQNGISGLEQYLNESDLILSRLNDESMFALRTKSFIQNHKKNIQLIQYLHSNGLLEHDELLGLMELIQDVSIKWEKYKDSFLKKLQTNNLKDLSKQKESLRSIVEAERNIAAFNI